MCVCAFITRRVHLRHFSCRRFLTNYLTSGGWLIFTIIYTNISKFAEFRRLALLYLKKILVHNFVLNYFYRFLWLFEALVVGLRCLLLTLIDFGTPPRFNTLFTVLFMYMFIFYIQINFLILYFTDLLIDSFLLIDYNSCVGC